MDLTVRPSVAQTPVLAESGSLRSVSRSAMATVRHAVFAAYSVPQSLDAPLACRRASHSSPTMTSAPSIDLTTLGSRRSRV